MKILYDGAIYSVQAAGGANRYWAKVIDHLPVSARPYLMTNTIRKTNYPGSQRLRTFYFKRFAFRPGRASLVLEKLYFKTVLKTRSFDVFHPSIYSENAAGISVREFKCPIVVTIHDMIEELYPEVDPMGLRHRQKAEVLEVASAVICVSHNTKRDLLKWFPKLKPAITVTHLASELDVSMSYGDRQVPQVPYFIFVGGRQSSYKNFALLLKAFSGVIAMNCKVRLCLVGPPLTAEEKTEISQLGLLEHISHAGQPDDQYLAKLYRCSLALVYPSLYEGFGIPPLEAMACGTLVIASNQASLPEVIGDAGILFDPHDVKSLTDILIGVARGQLNREAMIERGFNRASQFSWQRTADETFKVYREVAERAAN